MIFFSVDNITICIEFTAKNEIKDNSKAVVWCSKGGK